MFEVFQTFHRLAYRLVIRQHSAQPAMTDVRHFATLCLGADGIAGRSLRAHKKDTAAIGNHRLNERISVPSHGQALFKIDDVDFVSLAEDVRCHLRVPIAGLMTKVHASLKHLAHRNVCHDNSPG